MVNVESRGACRTEFVSSIHQLDQTSTLKLRLVSVVVGNLYDTNIPENCRSLTEVQGLITEVRSH